MDRTTIQALRARYVLEPELQSDIYVEGLHDQQLLTWYFSQTDAVGRRAIPISLVDVPESLVEGYGLPAGSNRSRVVALAEDLAKDFPGTRLLFSIDRDLEDFVATRGADFPEQVVITDLGTMDLYLFHEYAVEKIVDSGLRGFTVDEFRSSSFAVLRSIYSFRVAARTLMLNVRFLDIDKDISVAAGRVDIDLNSYVDRCLNASRLMNHRDDVIREINLTLNRCSDEGLSDAVTAHGHDLFALLKWLMNSRGGVKVCVDGVRRMLFMALTPGVLSEHKYFQRVLAL